MAFVDGVRHVVAVEAPHAVLFLRERRSLVEVVEAAEAPRRAHEVLRPRADERRPLAVVVEVDLELALAEPERQPVVGGADPHVGPEVPAASLDPGQDYRSARAARV
jgi:hypothetical protein